MINNICTGFVLTCISGLASPAFADDLSAFSDSARSLYADMEGKEIAVSGAIGTTYGDQLYFYDATGNYPILLDAGRSVRRELEGCEINPFLEPEQSTCQMSGMAEIQIDWDESNLSNGYEVELIIFEANIRKQ